MRLDVDSRALPVLVALANRAMTTAEVGKAVLMTGSSVNRYLNLLQDNGFIVKRWDKKWTLIVRLRLERVPGTEGEVVYEPRHDAQEAAGGAQRPADGPTPVQQAPKPPAVTQSFKTPPKGAMRVSAAATLVASRLKVPEWVKHRGEAGMSKTLGHCEGCKRPTPLRYGTHSICAVCARKAAGA